MAIYDSMARLKYDPMQDRGHLPPLNVPPPKGDLLPASIDSGSKGPRFESSQAPYFRAFFPSQTPPEARSAVFAVLGVWSGLETVQNAGKSVWLSMA